MFDASCDSSRFSLTANGDLQVRAERGSTPVGSAYHQVKASL